MAGQRGFWEVEERLKELSAEGDPLEKLSATVDFELFRLVLTKALGGSHPSKGGRPGFDPVVKSGGRLGKAWWKSALLMTLACVTSAGCILTHLPSISQ